MKATRITELDEVKDYPVGYILRSSGFDEMVGCCPRSFFNFFGLLGLIEGLNSEFLFWLKMELQEDDQTLITPPEGIKKFVKNPIFNNLDCRAGFAYEQSSGSFIYHLSEGWILFSLMFFQGADKPSHCEVYYIRDKKLFCDGVEISGQTFNQKIFCHKDNRYILGRKKAKD